MGLRIWMPLTGSSEFNNFGTINPTITTANITSASGGKVSTYCKAFNGSSSYINMPFTLTDSMTFCAWIKFNDTGNYHIIDARDSSTDLGYQPIYAGTTYGLQIYTHGGGSNNYSSSTCSFTTDTWYHIAAVIAPTYSELFINGVSKGRQALGYSSSSDAINTTLRIGTRCTGANWFNGYLQDLRIYNEILADSDIADLAKAECAHYTFNFEDLYKPLEYIQATGTQYIDTGFSTSTGMVCEYKANWQATGYVVGSHSGSSPYGRNGCYLHGTSTGWEFGYGETCPQYTATAGSNLNTDYTVYWSTKTSAAWLDVNGERLCSDSGQSTSTNTVKVFACDYPSTAASRTQAKLYYAKIWNSSDELVRNLIPALRKVDCKPGLFDTITGNFYTNAGSGEFIYPSDFVSNNVNSSNCTISGNSITITKSVDGWGNGGCNSNTKYSVGCYVHATIGQTDKYAMIGVATTNLSFNYTQGYFIYPSAEGHYHIYELGSHIGDMGTYAANDTFTVIYDSATIRYYHNDTLVRSVSATGTMRINITTYTAAATVINNVTYGTYEWILPDSSGFENNYAFLAMGHSIDTAIGTQSLKFNGWDNYILSTLSPAIITNGTICWWQKDTASYNRVLFSGDSSRGGGGSNYLAAGESGTSYNLYSSNAGTNYYYKDGVKDTTARSSGTRSSLAFSDDSNWHFYCISGIDLSSWSTLWIGGYHSSWALNCSIADIKIFNTVLSDQDIINLYKVKASIYNDGTLVGNTFLEE